MSPGLTVEVAQLPVVRESVLMMAGSPVKLTEPAVGTRQEASPRSGVIARGQLPGPAWPP